MKFVEVATIFNEIEKESSRLAITVLLANLLKKATPDQACKISYLSLGELNPTYVGTKFNFAEKSMIKVVAKYLHETEEEIKHKNKKIGDLGLLIESATHKNKIEEEFSVSKIVSLLNDFEEISGTGSQEIKEKKLLDILKNLDHISAKYIVRIILGKLRLGFSDMTLLDAFSFMHSGDKSIRIYLEESYNICADIGYIVKVLKEEGLEGIKKMTIKPGIPIRPAAAERMPDAKSIIKKLGTCIAQPKLDGFRLQVHLDKTKSKPIVKFFSRNLQDMSDMFPDLRKVVLDLDVQNIIFEGEAISYEAETGTFLPFQETVKRKRKYDIDKVSQDFPLKLYIFDILYLNDESMLDKTHTSRRKILLKLFNKKEIEEQQTIFVIEEKLVETAKELDLYFEQNISQGLEGLVVKKVDAKYQAGKRNFNWVKLKRQESGRLEDTIDCAILGYYSGHGKRAGFGIGALLVGVFDKKNDQFCTVAKIGTGLSDEEWKEIKHKCDKIRVDHKPKNVFCAKELTPDVWTWPEIVCMIRADEITLSPLHTAGKTDKDLGMALRFPRFMGYRPDKKAEQATDIVELKELFEIQFSGKSHKTTKKSSVKKDLDKKILSLF